MFIVNFIDEMTLLVKNVTLSNQYQNNERTTEGINEFHLKYNEDLRKELKAKTY